VYSGIEARNGDVGGSDDLSERLELGSHLTLQRSELTHLGIELSELLL